MPTTSTFLDIDPSRLEPHEAQVTRRAPPRAEAPLDPRMASLRRQVLDKASGAQTQAGENEERWPSEAQEAFLQQHPWASAYTISTRLTATDASGYGVGYFHLTPMHVPAAVAGPETVKIVTVPLIIRNYRIYPFDVFIYEGTAYPLTEARLTQILRLRDAFTEIDRDIVREEIRSNLASPLSLPSVGNGMDMPYKTSSSATERAAAVGAWIERHRVAAAGSETRDWAKESAGPDVALSQVRERALRENARPLGAYLAPETDPLTGTLRRVRVKVSWASDPDTGRHTVRDISDDLSLEKLSGMFGAEAVDRVLAGHATTVNVVPPDPAAVALAIRSTTPTSARATFGPAGIPTVKTSGAPAAVLSTFVEGQWASTPVRDGDLAVGDTVVGLPVSKHPLVRAPYYSSDTERLAFILTLAGVLMRSSDRRSIGPASSSETTVTPTKPGDGVGPVAVWEEDGAVYAMPLSNNSLQLDGRTFVSAGDYSGPSPSWVAKSDGIVRAYAEMRGDLTMVFLPKQSWIMGGSAIDSKGSPIAFATMPGTAAAEVVTPVTAEDKSTFPDEVKVAMSGARMIVTSERLRGIQAPFDRVGPVEAEFLLASAGVPRDLAVSMVKAAQAAPETVIQARYRAPALGSGVEVATQVIAKVSEVMNRVATQADTVVHQARALAKFSSTFSGALDGQAVDSVLGLGFLTRENILRFVSLVPNLEKTLSYLCSLLIGSRLGFDEVPEEAVSSAIRGLEAVIHGLKAVEYTLASNPQS